MRWKKTREEDKLNVIKAKLQDPQKSLRDLQEETGVNYVTSWDIIKETSEVLTSSNREEEMVNKLNDFLDDLLEIDKLQIKWYRKKLEEDKEILETKYRKAISDIGKTNFDRKQIISDKPTNIDKHQLDLSKVETVEQLREIRNKLLS